METAIGIVLYRGYLGVRKVQAGISEGVSILNQERRACLHAWRSHLSSPEQDPEPTVGKSEPLQ